MHAPKMNHTITRRPRRRRGVSSTLAMLYLALFSALSVGFYAAFTLASQTSYNERDARRALAAAESGMEFARYQLWLLNIKYAASTEELFNKVEAGLATNLNGTQNLKGGNIARVEDKLLIPASPTEYIQIDETGDGFRLEVTSQGTELVVLCFGRAAGGVTSSANSERAIRLRYSVLERPSSILNFGVASRGPVALDSNAAIVGSPDPALGSVLSASTSGMPVQLLSNSAISGDVSVVDPNGTISVSSSASIAGSTNPEVQAAHIHTGVAAPEFPTVDTDMFKKFATNVVSTPGAKFDTVNVRNLYIKANTNPIFSGSIKVEGVIYIETPNKVTFDSNVEVTGVIAGQNNPTGKLSQNQIEFLSNVKLRGVEHLPDTADFPAELRSLTGSSILAEGFGVRFDSNFGAQAGSIVASQINFDSNATGQINGNVLNLGDTPLTSKSNGTITIANPGDSQAPAGMFFGSRYVPLPGSYEEVKSW